MRFKKGDKVEFIWIGELKQGVVTEIEETKNAMSYQIKYSGDMGMTWLDERDLLSPAPVLKVPKLIGDFLENHSKEDGHTLHDLLCDLLTSRDSLDENVYDWIMENNNENGELLARAWLDGYEVEKEPLYWVQLIEGASGYLNVRNDGIQFINSSGQTAELKTRFTEKEIKAMDKGGAYWQFAVPVEDLEGEDNE
ncbi:DUF1642 domain-containing protein [Listeria monocytogenes]|uniref:DUF1642 domain-containing protein n=1 Tax=Listeria monocytogenes TaxID=1639 RepID=UPI00083CC622|nr:DUF1642 domain-containing protein [Listeria monocytogenes]EAD4855201.1 DUF1642 domain-containing protein [Listeria monocytogenes]EAE6676495.1 DUF1642 domain-containing protein [Listeria monocytogenes]EAF9617038.1 DUF1642 domain-containing protein [Listeria monocytogenes]EAG1560878.1 DUF1642 domain-containing protein [Listeria monocytogenes]EAG9505753.1 DUF1642 domain-containing protein [Listeria monocytogenes]